MIRFATIALVLVFAAPAVAADVGTCLTEAGLRLAPWTDPVDPACGEDCGPEPEVELVDGLCSTADGTCGADELAAALEMPEPSGPRCIEPGPTCGSGQPVGGGVASGVIALAPAPLESPAPRGGTLPGAGPPFADARPWERTTAPGTRPPRA